jgi:protocatechuate 3,4-dioxygenase beta subunit
MKAEGVRATQAQERAEWSRRAFLRMALAAPLPFLLAACRGLASGTATPVATAEPQPTEPSPTQAAQSAASQSLPPTPECGDDDEVTIAQTEGPYFTPNSPERTSLLEAGMAGTRLLVTGYVLSTGCTPIGRALVDFWHCDDGGAYDNVGYRLRGHQFTDEAGRYTLETIVPGLYPGRTRHIHVKVQAPNQAVLTTQLYFPDEPRNQSDGIYSPELLMNVQDSDDGKVGMFNFVLNVM